MSIMLRSQFPDFVLEDALPFLDFVVTDEYANFKTKHDVIFNVREMRSGVTQTSQVSDLEPAPEVGEGENFPTKKRYQGFDKTYTAAKYGLILATSQELIDDMDVDVLSRDGRALMKSFMNTVEILAADVLNSGSSSNGLDGVPLFSAAHPAVVPGVADQSNILGTPADLSATTLKNMMTLMRKTRDSAGNRINLVGKKLIVPAELEFLALELTQSTLHVDSANAYVNAINSVKAEYGVEPIVWDFLTDTDACYLQAEKDSHQMMFYWRKRPSVATKEDFKTEALLTRLNGRFAVGYSDWRGIVSNGR